MHVDSYNFGRIIIDGQEYNHDVLIAGGSVKSPWWRKAGHHLTLDDMKDLLKLIPKKLIIGTGYSGMMSVDGEVIKYCEENSIRLSVKNTRLAVEEFNDAPSSSAAFHLTC